MIDIVVDIIFTNTYTHIYAVLMDNFPHQHVIGHFGGVSFQSITCTGTDNLTRTTKRQNTQIT